MYENVLNALPVAVYTTDEEGRITFFNEAAAEFWGHRPQIGSDMWCGSWKLFWPDGRPMPHDECPMAVMLKTGKPVPGAEAVAMRPNGTLVPFLPYPSLLCGDRGEVVGGINVLVDVSDRRKLDAELARLAAIVSSSDDAIVSKTLDGRVTSWNRGAERIFGYTAEEMIGRPITTIIPADLRSEEIDIIAKLKRGERIEHFDTVRVAKDGRRVQISLTVSPLRDSSGVIVGASKVARDITERKDSEELQRVLFAELNHRVKNMLATIQAIANQSLAKAASPALFVTSFNGRVQALARAHDLLVQQRMKGSNILDIVTEQVLLGASEDGRVSCSGPFVPLDSRTTMELGLVLHELATNARKYGALSVSSGRLAITWTMTGSEKPELMLRWQERGVAQLRAPRAKGFGTALIERTIAAQGGEATMNVGEDGVNWTIRLPMAIQLPDLTAGVGDFATLAGEPVVSELPLPSPLSGRRVLLVEDEPLVAMDIECYLEAAGCIIVGPAASLQAAKRLAREERLDAALLDGNLAGHPVDEVAQILKQRGVPFVFATGYGRETLPIGFSDAPLLTKPFGEAELMDKLRSVLP